jgi:hypothetical protein
MRQRQGLALKLYSVVLRAPADECGVKFSTKDFEDAPLKKHRPLIGEFAYQQSSSCCSDFRVSGRVAHPYACFQFFDGPRRPEAARGVVA